MIRDSNNTLVQDHRRFTQVCRAMDLQIINIQAVSAIEMLKIKLMILRPK